MHSPLTKMHLFQTHDRKHFLDRDHGLGSCCVRFTRIRCPFDRFRRCISECQSLIFSVLENTGLPGFLCRFLRSIYRDSITHVDSAEQNEDNSSWPEEYDKVVLRVGFLFLEFLQPTQCADADDLAVASSSFRGLMYALAPAFRSVDCQDNTSKDQFSRCEICKNFGYRLSGR